MTGRDAAQDAHAAAIDAASSHGDAIPTGDLQQAALSPDAAIELPLPGEIAVLRVQPGQVLAFDFALAGLIREWVDGDLLLRAADGTSGEVRLSGFLDQAFGEHPVVVSFAGEPIELAQLLADGVSPEAMIEPAAGGSGGASAPEGGASFTPFVDQSDLDGERGPDDGLSNPLAGTELDLGQEDEEQDPPANRAFLAFSSGANDNNAVAPDSTASAPSLSTADATGSEDHAIPLDLSAGLTDLDGSETLAVTISGLPKGASLNAGTDNLDGTWSLTADQLAGLSLTPPADFSGPIPLTIAATATESASADGATTTANFSVIVEAIADAPIMQAANASGNEDSSIPLDLSATLADIDGSESLAVTISGLPTGASLSAGTDNLDGTWSLTADQLAGLSLTPPADFSGTIDLSISAISTESASADAATTTADFSVTVEAVADAPTVQAANANGSEDSSIPLDLSAVLADIDGSESLSVTISGLPNGASLSAGTDNHDGSWSLAAEQLAGLLLTPPADFSGTIDLSISATSTESASADSAAMSVDFSVVVEAIADAPILQAANASGGEDHAIALDLSAALADIDGSESLAVTISGLPTGASLSAGTDNHDGTWSLTADQLAGLSLTPPTNFSGIIDLSISATSTEGNNSDVATSSASFSISAQAVADAPTAQAANVSGSEDRSIALDLSAALADTDGSESLALKILGVPSGATLSAGIKNADGSWSVTGDQLSGLSLKPPTNFSGNINLSLSATATEGANGNAATTTTGFLVHVSPDADAPDLSAIAAYQSAPGGNGTVVSTNTGGSQKDALVGGIGGDTLVGNSSDDLIIGDYGTGPITVELNISAAVTDADGSETIKLTISGVPSGASLSAGTNLGGGAWLLQPAQLGGLTISVPSGTPDFTLAVTATVTDKFGSELDTLDQTVNVNLPVTSESPAGNDDIRGGSGDDTLLGGGGADTLNGASGLDLLRGEGGDDQMIGGSGADTLDGGAGSDSAAGGDGGDQLLGGDGADTLEGGASSDLLEGGAGADILIGGAGIDTASYAQSNAGVTINLSTGTRTGGDAQGDVLSTIENLIGSSHADRLTGNSSNNDLFGGAGGDVLTGGAGVDDLFGEGGNDRLVWDTQDKFDGGSSFDIIDARSSAGGTIDLRNATNLEAVVTGSANDTVRISLSDVLIDTADGQFFAVLGGGADRLRIDTSGGWTAVATTATPGPESAGADLGVDLSNLAVHSFTNGTSTVSIFTDAEVVTT